MAIAVRVRVPPSAPVLQNKGCGICRNPFSFILRLRRPPCLPLPCVCGSASGTREHFQFAKCFAFQTIRPVVSRKKRCFPLLRAGRAVPPPCVSLFSKARRSSPSHAIPSAAQPHNLRTPRTCRSGEHASDACCFDTFFVNVRRLTSCPCHIDDTEKYNSMEVPMKWFVHI